MCIRDSPIAVNPVPSVPCRSGQLEEPATPVAAGGGTRGARSKRRHHLHVSLSPQSPHVRCATHCGAGATEPRCRRMGRRKSPSRRTGAWLLARHTDRPHAARLVAPIDLNRLSKTRTRSGSDPTPNTEMEPTLQSLCDHVDKKRGSFRALCRLKHFDR